MYEVEICVRCNKCNLADRFRSLDDINDVFEYIADHPNKVIYTPCVCVDCLSELGKKRAIEMLKNFVEPKN